MSSSDAIPRRHLLANDRHDAVVISQRIDSGICRTAIANVESHSENALNVCGSAFAPFPQIPEACTGNEQTEENNGSHRPHGLPSASSVAKKRMSDLVLKLRWDCLAFYGAL